MTTIARASETMAEALGMCSSDNMQEAVDLMWNIMAEKDYEDRTNEMLAPTVAALTHSSHANRGVMAVNWMEQSGEWVKVKACVDSGCIEHVAPPEIAPGVETTPSELSKAGMCYSVANGEDIPNVGQKTFEAVTEGGQSGVMTTQLAEVTRPLMSVGQTCDNGNLVIFHKRGGFILNLESRALTPFDRVAGNYEIAYWVRNGENKEPNKMDFARQRM